MSCRCAPALCPAKPSETAGCARARVPMTRASHVGGIASAPTTNGVASSEHDRPREWSRSWSRSAAHTSPHLTALSGWAARSDRWLLLFAPHAQLAAPKLTPVDRCCACSSRRRNGEAEAAHRGEEDAERSEEGLGALNSTTGPRPALRRYAGDSKNCRPLSRPLSQSGHPRNATRPLPAL